jgi:hypothetical protein
MRSKIAEPEIAVMSRPVRRPWQYVATEPAELDAGLFMLALCKQLQTTCLDRRGIDCVLDAAETGRLPEVVCRMLGLIVRELIADASECPQLETAPRTIKVTLGRRGTTCLCTIFCQGLMDPFAGTQPGLQRVQQLAAEFHECCTVRPMPDRGIAAIMFDAHLVERCFPAALWRYRVGEARRRAQGHFSTVQE